MSVVLVSDETLREYTTRHEGVETHVYPDPDGTPTIGVGYNMAQETARADFAHIGASYNDVLTGETNLTYEQIQNLFSLSLARAISDVQVIFGEAVSSWPFPAQYAVVDMAFTLGRPRFLGFHLFIAAMRAGNYAEAAIQAVDSEWGMKEAVSRAAFDASLLRGCASSTT